MTARYDPLLGYMPAIPEPFHGRVKWWHFRTHFVCGECKQGFNKRSEYECHYALTHIEPTESSAREA